LSNREVLLPDSDRIWVSVGGTYHFSNKLSFDLGYSHGFLRKGKIQVVPGHPQFPTVGLPFYADTRHAYFDILSAALTYRWDDPGHPADHPQILRSSGVSPSARARRSTPTLSQRPASERSAPSARPAAIMASAAARPEARAAVILVSLKGPTSTVTGRSSRSL